MNKLLETLSSRPKTVFGAVALGSLYWKKTEVWEGFTRNFMTSSLIHGARKMGDSSNSSTETFYFDLLRFINNLLEDRCGNRNVQLDYYREKNAEQSELTVLNIPGYGSHRFWYKNCLFFLDRRLNSEALILQTFHWNRPVLDDLLKTVREEVKNKYKDEMTFWYAEKSDWKVLTFKARRPLETVILKDDLKENLLKDVQDFLKSKAWYVERGIPYHRGYLLYGPPGSGKSSLVKALAGAIEYAISILSLSADGMTDDQLNITMNRAARKSVILLEDVDAAFKSREGESENPVASAFGSSKVTFKGLLNALDGVASADGRIIFITTNHIKKLDPALIRPGRVDMKILIDYPTKGQIVQMFSRFYKTKDAEMATRFAQIVLGLKEKVSMASLQNLFIMYKDSPEKAISNAEERLMEWACPSDNQHLNIYV